MSEDCTLGTHSVVSFFLPRQVLVQLIFHLSIDLPIPRVRRRRFVKLNICELLEIAPSKSGRPSYPLPSIHDPNLEPTA